MFTFVLLFNRVVLFSCVLLFSCPPFCSVVSSSSAMSSCSVLSSTSAAQLCYAPFLFSWVCLFTCVPLFNCAKIYECLYASFPYLTRLSLFVLGHPNALCLFRFSFRKSTKPVFILTFLQIFPKQVCSWVAQLASAKTCTILRSHHNHHSCAVCLSSQFSIRCFAKSSLAGWNLNRVRIYYILFWADYNSNNRHRLLISWLNISMVWFFSSWRDR